MNIQQIADEFGKVEYKYGMHGKLNAKMFAVDVYALGWRITDRYSTRVNILITNVCGKNIVEYISLDEIGSRVCRVAFTMNGKLEDIVIGGMAPKIECKDKHISTFSVRCNDKRPHIYVWREKKGMKMVVDIL